MRIPSIILITCLALAAPLRAQEIDPHALYERACAACHEAHAGDFARASLADDNGRIVGRRSGAPLDRLLQRHRGTVLSDAERAALIGQFGFILRSGGLYRDRCIVCHDRAERLATLELIVREGVLEGRYSGRAIDEFLQDHGRLTPDERQTILTMLHRQLGDPGPDASDRPQ